MLKIFQLLLTGLLLAFAGFIASPELSAQQMAPPASPNSSAGVGVGDIQPLLADVDQFASSTRLNLAKLRIEKWKTQSDVKNQAISRVQSLDSNLTQALPTLLEHLRANPQGLAPNFAVYRNMNALFEVLETLAEAAGAFGSNDEYRALAANAASLDAVRRSLAGRMERLSSDKDAEILRLRAQAAQRPPAPEANPMPARIIVDDAVKPKAPAKKRTQPASPAKAPATQTAQ
ncbi:MAG TPA: hypothetical protein VG892_06895 [Terriglobales bacterium]|jgi:hypothetical protein|nr:hypothetical protein [Terriglobales bacterium]